MRLRPDEDATDALIMAYCMQRFDGDGSWWCEDYDPSSLSAPRSAIFPDRVGGWKIVEADFREVDDEEELAVFDAEANSASIRL